MNEKYLLSRIAQKHDIETNWNNSPDFIPMRGELIVYDIDANYDYERLKIGDGATTVVNLPFINEEEFFSLQQKIDKIIDNGIFKKEFEEKNLIYFWDFRTGSFVDQIQGVEATTASTVELDSDGAHLVSQSSYIMFPANVDGSTLSGHTMEVKFGQMSLNAQASTLRLVCSCLGSQPASTGIIWTSADCWSNKSANVTEFTDLHMFSGKTLYAKGAADSTRVDWYCEDQLICSTEPSSAHTHMSIGSSSISAYPAVVEYVKIYPTLEKDVTTIDEVELISYQKIEDICAPTITFTIDDKSFKAIKGMRWLEWVETEYNTDNYFIDDKKRVAKTWNSTSNKCIRYESGLVYRTDFIIEEAVYDTATYTK